MTNLFHITCKSHLHAGSGDSNFGVIDKLVQKDPADQIPCIYASSVKGALREYWEEKLQNASEAKIIFGADDTALKEKGAVIFHQAYMLSIPARSNKYPYFNITSPVQLQFLAEQNDLLETGIDLSSLKLESTEDKIKVYSVNTSNLKIEDFEEEAIIKLDGEVPALLKQLVGERPAIVSHNYFKQLCSDYSLPVIARNNLENGQSKNLWYEQIVPRESRFFFGATQTPGKDGKTFFNHFDAPHKVQIGANATIGYGQCFISKLQ